MDVNAILFFLESLSLRKTRLDVCVSLPRATESLEGDGKVPVVTVPEDMLLKPNIEVYNESVNTIHLFSSEGK
jgi:hypothetical protein